MRELLSRAKGIAGGAGSANWWVAFVSLFVSLSFVLRTGPQIQTYALALINSDHASFYASAYNDELVHFLGLKNWLFGGGLPSSMFVFMAIPIAFASLRNRQARRIAQDTLATSFLVLVVADLVVAIFASKLTIAYSVENLFADFIGSFFIAAFVLFMLALGSFVCDHVQPSLLATSAASLLIMAGGVFFATFAYYAVEFLYKPVPVNLMAVLEPPISGGFGYDSPVVDALSDKTDEGRPDRFRFFPEHGTHSKVGWESGWGKLRTHWTSLSPQTKFKVTISLYDGCPPDGEQTKLPEAVAPVVVSDIRSLDLWFEDESTNFTIIGDGGVSGKLTLDYDGSPLFSLDKLDKAKNTIEVKEVVDEDARMRIGDDSGHVAFYVSTSLYKQDRSKIIRSRKLLHIRYDQKDYAITVDPHTNAAGPCIAIPTGQVLNLQSSKAHFFIGVLVKIEAEEKAERDSFIRVGGGGGWIKVTTNVDDLQRNNEGRLDMIGFSGKAAYLEIGGVTKATTEFDEYSSMGTFEARYEDAGRVRVNGPAVALWKNGKRLSPTKWEQLEVGYQTALVTLVLATFGLISKVLQKLLSNNTIMLWPRVQVSNVFKRKIVGADTP